MNSVESVILETPNAEAARAFYADAFGLDDKVQVRESDSRTTGFRGFTLSLVTSQPANADALIDAAVSAGASVLKPASKSLWGYGGVVEAPDGAIWQVVSSSKKDTEPAAKHFDNLVLLLGVAYLPAAKRFYVDHGFEVAKSFGNRYAEFASDPGNIGLALQPRKSLAKLAGVRDFGEGSHRLVITTKEGTFTDPDGFVWESNEAA